MSRFHSKVFPSKTVRDKNNPKTKIIKNDFEDASQNYLSMQQLCLAVSFVVLNSSQAQLIFADSFT